MADDISQFVDDLFQDQPEESAALKHRLQDVDSAELRRELLDRVAPPSTAEYRELTLDVLSLIGLDDDARDRLYDWATAGQTDSELRQFSFVALMFDEQFDSLELASKLSPETMDDLMEVNLSMFMEHAEEFPEVAFELAGQLFEVSGPHRQELFSMMEKTRRKLGHEAGLVYAGLFGDRDYQELWPMLAGAVVDDGTPGDAELLDEAAARASDDEVERQLRQSAMELRTRGIEEPVDASGIALFGSCDGTGGYPVLIGREREDGSLDFINILFRVTGEYRDAMITELDSYDDFEHIVERMNQEAGADFVEVSLGTVAELVEQRMKRAQQFDDDLPTQFDLVRQRVRRLGTAGHELGGIEPAEDVPGDERIDQLLDHWRYDYWLLDRSVFIESGLSEPTEPDDPPEEWYDDALRRLSTLSGFVEQTAALADHMARWHALRGDDEVAGEFAALAAATRDEPGESPLIRHRLDQTLEAIEASPGGDDFPIELIEDPEMRRSLRQRFFSNIDNPRGSHVVHLTLTCVVFVIFDWGMNIVSPERQPRPDKRYDLAYRAAGQILGQLTRAGAPDPEELHGAIAGEFVESSLQAQDASRLAALVLEETQEYLDTYAQGEFFEALSNPQRPMADAFFT